LEFPLLTTRTFLSLSHHLIVRENEKEEGEEEEMEEERDDSAWHLVPLSAKMLSKWFSSQVLQNHVIAGTWTGADIWEMVY
jgi:hypothetical protein